MKKTIAFLMCCVALPVWAAEVSFSAPEVAMGDMVQLIFKSDKSIQALPDLKGVEQHFVVAGTQQRMNSSFVNGKGTQSYELIYNLFPKALGMVDLTGLTLNNESLPNVSINVVEQSATTVAPAGDGVAPTQVLTLTGNVQQNQIYQGESFLYRVQLVENVGIEDGAFQPPEMPGARVQPMGPVKTRMQTVEGQPARLIEQSFLMTPEGTGTLTVPPAVFNGTVLDKQTRSRPRPRMMPEFFDNDILFGGFRPVRPVYLQTKPVTVTVEAQPADWQGWWLPSTDVVLSEQYNLPNEIYAGTPFERKVVLTARGVDGNGLPLITVSPSEMLNVYPSPEKRQTQLVNQALLGMEEVVLAFVPTQPGTITVPGIQIPWFDTQTKQRKIATLPEKVITVLPPLGQINDTTSSQALTPNITGVETVSETEPTPKTPAVTPETSTVLAPVEMQTSTPVFGGVTPRMLAILFGGGVLAGLLGAFVTMKLLRPRPPKRTLGSVKPVEKKQKKKKPLPDLYPF